MAPTHVSKRSLLAVLSLLSVVVVDCSGLTSEESYVGKLSDSQCAWARACCETSELMSMLGLSTSDSYSVEVARAALDSQAKCVDLMHARFVTTDRTLLESIRSGRTKLDTAKLDACIKLYEQAKGNCKQSPLGKSVTDACQDSVVFTGQQAAGAICYLDVDCVTGATCWGATGSAPGLCRAKSAEGQACRSDTECPDTDSCAAVASRDNWCAASDKQSEGKFCASDSQCGSGLFCDTNAQACASLLASDAECFQNRQCLSGRCNQDQRKCEAPAASSGSCNASTNCQAGLWCDTTSTNNSCGVPLSTGKAGDPCDSNTPCGTGLACISSACRAPVADGASCNANTDCQVGSSCDLAGTHVCRARKAKGVSCASLSAGDCAAGLYCSSLASLTCVDRVALGSACGSSAPCVETARCNTTTGNCEALFSAGTTCSTGSDCASGLLCQHWAGRCATRASSGAMCNLSEACPTTEYCGSGGGYVCQTGTKAGAGQSCNNASTVCNDGYYCSSGAVCAPRLAEDAGCSSAQSACAVGTYCSLYSSPYRCTQYANLAGLCSIAGNQGALCAPGTLCAQGSDGGYGCVLGKAAGVACSTAAECAGGLLCPSPAYVCTAALDAGAACSSGTTLCGVGNWCRGFTGTCAGRLAESATCTSSGACVTALECVAHDVCTARAKVDETCDADRPCGAGLRCDGEWGKCVALKSGLALGETCRASVECASGQCSGQQCVGYCEGVKR